MVRVYHAGSLDAAVSDLGPDFTATTGYVLAHVRGPSGALADQIRNDEIQPDVFMSADADVNDTLMGPSNGNHVSWYALIARQRMVLLYSSTSRFTSAFAAIATGGQGLDAVLNSPGLRLVRDDPTNDPAGYRALFVFELAEGEPLGTAHIFPESIVTSTRYLSLPLVAIIPGTFMVILDNTVVNVALPTLGRAFDTDLSVLQWVISA